PRTAKAMSPRITSHLNVTAKRTSASASSCDAAKIQSTWRTPFDFEWRPNAQDTPATTASPKTAHFVRSCETATMSPSAAAIQSESRTRRAFSQTPGPRSAGCDDVSVNTFQPYHAGAVSQLRPRRLSERRAARHAPRPKPLQRPPRALRVAPLLEEPVQRRACAGDIGAERACRENRVGMGRAREAVRGQRGQVAWPLDSLQPVEERLSPLRPAGGALASVERGVDVGRRGLLLIAWEQDDDPEVLRQVQPPELAPVPRAQLRPVGHEERDVSADPCRNAAEPFPRERVGKRLVGEPERSRRVGAPATE